MPKQDPRMTEDAKNAVEEFLSAVVDNDNEMIIEFLDLEPTLIYARNGIGNTAINSLIIRGRPSDLATLQVILDATRENGTPPDYRLANEDGWTAYTALQVHAGEALNHEFAAAIGVQLSAPTQASVYTADQYAVLQAREDAYFNNNPSHRTIDQIDKNAAGKANIYTALTNEPTYGDELNKLFSDKKWFTNFDNQKSINAMNAEVDAVLKTLSFAPVKPLTPFLSSLTEATKALEIGDFINIHKIPGQADLQLARDDELGGYSAMKLGIISGGSEPTIIVIPQELSDLFGKIYDYFFGNQDHHL